ncbi:MAG TPA: M14 family zinc carboxypeptidase [Bacteroidota bacterium]|nr:M14 family zinc carboxypeptidase [Bacteroidota bacterium]
MERPSQSLFQSYDSFRSPAFSGRAISPELFQSILDNSIHDSGGLLRDELVGKSYENRPIRLLTAGSGPNSVLLWSQMHGDESTATMAIVDILQFLIRTKSEESTRRMLSSVTLQFLPILNPDGASRFQRRTAQNIDMNRDALALRTPEAKLLADLQMRLKPRFGFNLHDQELSTAGSSKELTALAFLAPAYNVEKSSNDVRSRAKKLAAFLAVTLDSHAAGRLARYDDAFEPRAFGDNMQKWGTSTVLIESGHAMNDPDKNSIRKLNAVGLISAFESIAGGTYLQADESAYDRLPFNGKLAYDVIIRNILIDEGGGRTTEADLGISYQVDTHSELPPRLVDLGDLSTYTALRDIDGGKKRLSRKLLRLNQPFNWEPYFPNALPPVFLKE